MRTLCISIQFNTEFWRKITCGSVNRESGQAVRSYATCLINSSFFMYVATAILEGYSGICYLFCQQYRAVGKPSRKHTNNAVDVAAAAAALLVYSNTSPEWEPWQLSRQRWALGAWQSTRRACSQRTAYPWRWCPTASLLPVPTTRKRKKGNNNKNKA